MADNASVAEDGSVVIDVLANDAHADGRTLSVVSVNQPSHGSVVILNDGTLLYTPDANYNGADSFSYTLQDDFGVSSSASVSVNVTSVNDAPVVVAIADVAVGEDLALGTVIATVSASDIDGDVLSYSIVGGNDDGLFSIDAASGVITLAQSLDFETAPTHDLTIRVSDGTTYVETSFSVDVEEVIVAEPTPVGNQNVIVIIDTGNFEDSPEYIQLAEQYDIRDDDPDAYSSYGHGKAVEKSVYDIVGDDTDTQIIHLKIAADNTSAANVYVIEDAFQYVLDNLVDAYDVVAVNLSYEIGFVSNDSIGPFGNYFQQLEDNGTMVSIIAGNTGQHGTSWYANSNFDNVLTISATDGDGQHANYSNEGDFTDYYAVGTTYWHDNGSYDEIMGTSFAAPRVAGMVAQIQEMAEEMFSRLLSVDEVLDVLDAVTDTITGYFTGVEKNMLTYDGVMKAFSNVFDVAVEIDSTADLKLIYYNGEYSIENNSGSFSLDLVKDAATLNENMTGDWDPFQIEANTDGGYTLVLRQEFGDTEYIQWDFNASGEFISETILTDAALPDLELVVGYDLNDDLTIGGGADAGAVMAASSDEMLYEGEDIIFVDGGEDFATAGSVSSYEDAESKEDGSVIEIDDIIGDTLSAEEEAIFSFIEDKTNNETDIAADTGTSNESLAGFEVNAGIAEAPSFIFDILDTSTSGDTDIPI